jgi:hypothetical protein
LSQQLTNCATNSHDRQSHLALQMENIAVDELVLFVDNKDENSKLMPQHAFVYKLIRYCHENISASIAADPFHSKTYIVSSSALRSLMGMALSKLDSWDFLPHK